MKAWIHSTPLWKQQSSGQDPSFSRHSLPCSLSFPLRSLLFGDPWRTPSLAEPPLARSSRLSFFRRFIPYGSGSSPQNLSNGITQFSASERQPTSRISKRNRSRSKQKTTKNRCALFYLRPFGLVRHLTTAAEEIWR